MSAIIRSITLQAHELDAWAHPCVGAGGGPGTRAS